MPGQTTTAQSLTAVSVSFTLYVILQTLFPKSYVPVFVLTLLMSSTLYKSSFPWLVRRFIAAEIPKERQALVDAIVSLHNYESASLNWNNKKKRNLKFSGWEAQTQAKQIGYLDHIENVANSIKENAQLANAIAQESIQTHDISALELRAGTFTSNGKVIEALSHYARDWTEVSEELNPVLKFIESSVQKYVKHPEKTLVIVPGSGLGRIAHDVAQLKPFKQVEAVEFSSLMYLCNQFVYSSPSSIFKIAPFLHSYSHHINTQDQLRTVQFTKQSKPSNLNINYGDFREFTVPNIDEFDNILVVSAFFLDTAQDLFQYFQSIESLIGDKKGIWINVGPLKYGTAPFIELSLQELTKLRQIRGWKDLDEPPAGEIAGYLTDKKSLWQGYYGLGKWVTKWN